MKRRNVIIIWTVIFALLLIVANTVPTIAQKTESEDFTYEHPEDNYTLQITGMWQVYDQGKTDLTLVNAEKDCAITMELEVGGYDYLTPTAAAEKFIEANQGKFSDFTVTQGPAEGNIGGYTSAAYLCSFSRGKAAFCGEQAVVHPTEGIRLYISYVYPADCDTAAIEEGEAIIRSLKFIDTEALYPKFM
ncbi:MAG: hypothetical protein Q4C00_02275 [Bacillota bacterium]|nr:hypothetical protein [Bacillota bacterium]